MNRGRQLPLDLGHRPALTRDSYLVSATNQAAFDAIGDPALRPDGRLILCGPQDSGKTHLAAIWASVAGAAAIAADALNSTQVASLADGGAFVIEDADRIAGQKSNEHALFHALNLSAAHGARMLITGRSAPAHWPIVTPDVASRLQSLPMIAIGPPDDTLLSSILNKLFSDRQLSVSPDATRFLVSRMERTFAAAERIVEALDNRALADKRPVTRNLAMELLASEPDVIFGMGEI